MMVDLKIASWAIAGLEGDLVPRVRAVDMPPPGELRRSARLPGVAERLALELADRVAPSTSVFVGTAHGCVTETAAFVDPMIRDREASPRPRAFASSVHNAVASRVALALGAHGECTTVSHGGVSFAHAVFGAARRLADGNGAAAIAGGLDETHDYVVRGREALGFERMAGPQEGGALFLLEEDSGSLPTLARIRQVAFGRPRDPSSWLERTLVGRQLDVLMFGLECVGVLPPGALRASARRTMNYADLVGAHCSAGASAVAVATGLVSGESDPATLRLRSSPDEIGVLMATRFGDLALVVVAR